MIALGLLVLTSGSAFGWGKERRARNDAAKAHAMGHEGLARWIRSGDGVQSHTVGPSGVMLKTRSGGVYAESVTPRPIQLPSGATIPAGATVSIAPSHTPGHAAYNRYSAFHPNGDRIRVTGQDVPLLRQYLKSAIGGTPP